MNFEKESKSEAKKNFAGGGGGGGGGEGGEGRGGGEGGRGRRGMVHSNMYSLIFCAHVLYKISKFLAQVVL